MLSDELENIESLIEGKELLDCKIESDKTNKIWFALFDEIINYKSICGVLIDSSVTNFFVTIFS